MLTLVAIATLYFTNVFDIMSERLFLHIPLLFFVVVNLGFLGLKCISFKDANILCMKGTTESGDLLYL